MNTLPLYRVKIEDESLDCISLCEFPATEERLLAFSDNTKKPLYLSNEEKHIIIAPLMLADVPIYRREGDYEYNILFTKEDIQKLAINYFDSFSVNKFDTEHNWNTIEGIRIFQSIIIDNETGVLAPKGLEHLPQGSWVVGAYVNNVDVWEKIKDGEFKGLSLAGIFNLEKLTLSQHKEEKTVDDMLKDLYEMLTK